MSAQELKKAWLSPKLRRKKTRQKKQKKNTTNIKPPQVNEKVSLYFEARFCCVSGAKAGVCCSHPAKVLSVSATKFRAMCSDKSEWDVVIQQKRTGLFPHGTWTHLSANATAHVADDNFDDDL